MEEQNRQIQARFDKLLQQYDDLAKRLPGEAGGVAVTSGAHDPGPSADAADSPGADLTPAAELAGAPGSANEPEFDYVRDFFVQLAQGAGSEGTLGRRRMDLTGPLGTSTEPLTPAAPPPTTPSPFGPTFPMFSASENPRAAGSEGLLGRGPLGASRMDRIGAGAEGTGGRVWIEQQPTAAGAAIKEKREEEWVYTPDAKPRRYKANVGFAEGLEFTSDNDEFTLQFHNLTQVDYRGFPKNDQGYLQSQFVIPRERWYFIGDITKTFGFYTVINRGYGSLDLLDAFVSVRVDERLRFRIGRMKTPYLYEYFQIAEGDLISPERSIFADNMGLNRQVGALALGTLYDGRLDYATGVYNGPRNSFLGNQSAKDFIGTATARPWLNSEALPALRYLNLGGSWDLGYENAQQAQPTYFETANDQTSGNGAAGVSPTFLALNKNVVEYGERIQWAAHAVWYYKSLFLMAEYGGGRAGYSFLNSNYSVPVSYSGWFVQASYFLTGEQLTRRVAVAKPRRDFNFDFLRGGSFSPGAVELQARYSTMQLSKNIFTSGFADPNLWTNHVWATDVGVNWYLNFYTKVQLDWQHSEFGNLVSVGPNSFRPTIDLFWLRFQLFF